MGLDKVSDLLVGSAYLHSAAPFGLGMLKKAPKPADFDGTHAAFSIPDSSCYSTDERVEQCRNERCEGYLMMVSCRLNCSVQDLLPMWA